MAMESVAAKVTSGDRAGEEFRVNYDIPSGIQEAVEKFGDEVVFSRFKQSLVIDLQSFMRTNIKKDGATAETVQEAVDGWMPGTRQPAKPLSEKIADLLGKMTPDERKAFLEEYI